MTTRQPLTEAEKAYLAVRRAAGASYRCLAQELGAAPTCSLDKWGCDYSFIDSFHNFHADLFGTPGTKYSTVTGVRTETLSRNHHNGSLACKTASIPFIVPCNLHIKNGETLPGR